MSNKSIIFSGNSRRTQVVWNQTTGIKALMLGGGLLYAERASGATGMNIVEAPDTFAASGNVGYVGVFTATENHDIFNGAGGIPDTGTWTDVENADHFSAFAFVPPRGTFNTTEAPDTMGNGRQERFEIESAGDVNTGSAFTFNTNGPDRIICIFVGAYGSGSASDSVTSIVDSTGLTWHPQDYLDIGPDEQSHELHIEMWWAYAPRKITGATCTITMGGGFSFAHVQASMMFIKGMGGNFTNPFSDANPYSYGSNFGGFVTPPNSRIGLTRPVATGPLSASGSVTNSTSFDPTSVHGVTLDGTHLKATSVGSGGPNNYATIPVTDAKITGKVYLEAKFVNIAGSKYGAGFAWASDSANQITATIGNGTGGFVVRGDGTIWAGGVQVGTIGCTPANNDIIGLAIDIDNNAIFARDVTQNTPFNNRTGSPALPQYSAPHYGAGGLVGSSGFQGTTPPAGSAHLGGMGYVMPFACTDGSSASAEIDINFGATAFVGTPPPGYSGWGTPAPAITPTRVEQHAIVLGWDMSVPDDSIIEAPPGFTLNYSNTGASAGFRLSVYSKVIAQNILTTDAEVMTHATPTKHWAMLYDTLVAGHVSPGTLESTEAADGFHAVGYRGSDGPNFGFLTALETTDVFTATGNGPVVIRWVSNEAKDIFSAFISVPIQAAFNVVEAPDRFTGTGIGRGEDGVFISTEAVDLLTITGIVPVIGSFDTTETADRFRAIGAGVTSHRKRRRRAFVS